MKTVFIDCSPKRKLSVSGFIADFTKAFVIGKTSKVKLRTRGDNEKVFEEVKDADNIVFCMPLYVDGIPSHILYFLKKIEQYFKGKKQKKRIYVIANNGFIEGRQNEPLMQVMENFCYRSNLEWCGGLGIGGGVMLNVLRILLIVFFIIMLLTVVEGVIRTGNFLQIDAFLLFLKQVMVVLLLASGIIVSDIGIAICINKGKGYGKHYTRIMLPSFLFIVIADLFFTILSVISGGVFRGWFARKKPTECD